MDRIITEREAAKLAGWSCDALIKWRREGRGPQYIRVGRSIRYRLSDLLDWIEEHTVKHVSSSPAASGPSSGASAPMQCAARGS